MADKDEMKKRIIEDEDYIRAPKFSNSLAKFLAKNPDGSKDHIIAKLLLMSEEEVEKIYQEAVHELREEMTDDVD